MQPDSWLDRVLDCLKRLNKTVAMVAGFSILLMNALVFLEVILRYGFNSPTTWSLEVSSYLLLFAVFMGAAHTLQMGDHVRVEFLLDRLPRPLVRIVEAITPVMAMFFLGVLFWQVWRLTAMAFKGHWLSDTLLAVPLGYVYLIMPVGLSMLIITYVVIWLHVVARGKLPRDDGGH